jgi:F0F1-type ATP synthase membrane subunit b/b'
MPTIAAIIDEYNADIKQQLAEARAANERRDAIVAAATAFAAKWNDKESQGLLESFCGLMSALQD